MPTRTCHCSKHTRQQPRRGFLINIHSGGYAVPNGNQPDFRTQWGEAIDDQSGLAGYPAGTINRQNFPGQEQGNQEQQLLEEGNGQVQAIPYLAKHPTLILQLLQL